MKQLPLNLLLWSVILLYGCYPDEITSINELDVILTEHEPSEFEPNTNLTYYIPDSVGLLAGDTPLGWASKEALILKDIKQNMSNYNYQLVAQTANPDVVIIPEVILTDNYVVGGGGGYCYWWWYDPWCYGGYYPPYYSYSYSTGTILMSMIKTENLDAESPGDDIIWTGVINGLLRDTAIPSSTITSYIDQAFSQSSYLEASVN